MPIGHSPAKLSGLRAFFFSLDLVAPIAILYSAYYIYTHLQTTSATSSSLPLFSSLYNDIELNKQHIKGFQIISNAIADPSAFFITTLVPFYLFLEASFYVFFLLQRTRLQRDRPVPLLSQDDRPKFFFRMMDELPDDWEFRKFFAGWFYWTSNQSQLLASEFHDIYRNDMKDWIAWAFFSSRSAEDVAKGPNGRQMSQELEQFVQDIEQTRRIRFQPGRNPKSVEAYHKPLFLYATIYVLESVGGLVLRVLGFDKYNSQEERFTSKKSALEDRSITYWARFPDAHSAEGDHHAQAVSGEEAFVHMFDEVDPFSVPTSPSGANRGAKKESLPIVFFHGIGGGLFSYIGFIYRILSANRNRAIFLVELPYVSMRLVDHVPSMQQTVHEVEDMLHHHGFPQAFFIGHSLGTAVTAWMMNNSKVVAGSALLDPIVFKTYHPSLAYNFVYRHPGKNTAKILSNEYLMHWLVGRELYISYFISRHFCWHQNVMWPEDLPKNHFVVVSSKDQLIDGDTVVSYLKEHKVNHSSYELDHAEFLTCPEVEIEVVQKITQTIQNADTVVKAPSSPFTLMKKNSRRKLRK
ncbi:hypothetical protein BC829DRAFT_417631 [Chytridium lagenaria]|nr:hypothetical protein BC829DRAFT_417631 [Chytridium lagenaria]